jgi:nucleoside diphosphate kinase
MNLSCILFIIYLIVLQSLITTCFAKRQTTFAMIKPDGIPYTNHIVNMLTQEGFQIVSINRIEKPNDTIVKQLYREHANRSFFNELVDHILSGPILTMILERPHAVNAWRQLMTGVNDQETDSVNETSNTTANIHVQSNTKGIRPLYASDMTRNVVHGSDSVDNALREIMLMSQYQYVHLFATKCYWITV